VPVSHAWQSSKNLKTFAEQSEHAEPENPQPHFAVTFESPALQATSLLNVSHGMNLAKCSSACAFERNVGIGGVQ
jgi:hypothetical protein